MGDAQAEAGVFKNLWVLKVLRGIKDGGIYQHISTKNGDFMSHHCDGFFRDVCRPQRPQVGVKHTGSCGFFRETSCF